MKLFVPFSRFGPRSFRNAFAGGSKEAPKGQPAQASQARQNYWRDHASANHVYFKTIEKFAEL